MKQQLLRFVAVGALVFLLEIALFFVLVQFSVPPFVANVVSRGSIVFIAFWLQGRYTFQTSNLDRAALMRYWLLWVVLTTLSTWSVNTIANLPHEYALMIGKPLTEMVAAMISFLVARRWVFRLAPAAALADGKTQ